MSTHVAPWDQPGTARPLTFGVQLDILSGCVFSQEVETSSKGGNTEIYREGALTVSVLLGSCRFLKDLEEMTERRGKGGVGGVIRDIRNHPFWRGP